MREYIRADRFARGADDRVVVVQQAPSPAAPDRPSELQTVTATSRPDPPEGRRLCQ
jgi:hypothetical protein